MTEVTKHTTKTVAIKCLLLLVVKNSPASAGDTRERVQSLGREGPLEKGLATLPVFLPGKSHGQRSLWGYIEWGRKELDMTEQLSAHIF